MPGSSALICATAWEYCLMSRWLRLPKMRVGRLAKALSIPEEMSVGGAGKAPRKPLILSGKRGATAVLPGTGYGLRRLEELGRVLRAATVAHLEVQVRAGGAAGRADLGDLAAALQDVALADEQLRSVRVAGDQVVAVVDVDRIAVLRVEAGEDDYASGGGVDRRAGI